MRDVEGAVPYIGGTSLKEVIIIEKIYRAFSLEIWESDPQLSLSVHQGETSRALCVSLTHCGQSYIIPENHRAVFTALKPDGKLIFNPCQIQDNKILYTLTPQTTAVVGLLSCQLRLYGQDDALILSPRFSLLVRPSVYTDDAIIESRNEVSALTALVSETHELIDEVRQSLTDGAFVPQFSIGTVDTLPSGHMAEVSLSGTGFNPVLNFKIPQGPLGQVESLIPDSILSETSTNPVQNRVIFDALSKKVENEQFSRVVESLAPKESLSVLATKEELKGKQDKVSGKGLSENDFTDAYKAKLDGIEAGANKFSLADSAVSTAKIADYAVTANKLASSAKSKAVAVTLAAGSWSNNTQTVSVSGVTASNNVIVAPAPESREAYTDAEIYCSAQASGKLTFKCSSAPAAAITVNVLILV